MGTLAELKGRIAREMNRADLAAAIAEQVARAIEFHADRRFWFNEDTRSVMTAPGAAVVEAPAGLRVADAVFVETGGQRHSMRLRSLEAVTGRAADGIVGRPMDYAVSGGRLHLYPTPDAAYALSVTGVYELAALADDGAGNAWTGAAADLIAGRAMAALFAITLRDPEGAAAAKAMEQEALKRLRGETARRSGVGVMEPAS